MKPYFDDGTVTLYHGDCRDILPALEVCDLLLTDPPYGVNWQSSRGAHAKLANDDGSLGVEWLTLALEKVRRGRHAYVFGMRTNEVPEGINLCGLTELIWDKGVMGLGDIESPWGPGHEVIMFGVQEISKANRAKNYGVTAARLRKASVLRVQRPHSAQTLRHPTEKPLELLRVLIESSSTFGEIVLDPFAGSGSALEAARVEGRRAIGIELEERFCEIAANRLAQGVLFA